MKTQRQRVLAALRATGSRGITAVDFAAPATFDGGAPILRLPSRINELRDAGVRIEVRGRRHRCAVYVLTVRREPRGSAGTPLARESSAPRAPQAATLGVERDPWAAAPRCAIFDADWGRS